MASALRVTGPRVGEGPRATGAGRTLPASQAGVETGIGGLLLCVLGAPSSRCPVRKRWRSGAAGKEGGEVPAGRRGPGLPRGSQAPAVLPQIGAHRPVSAFVRGLQKWGAGAAGPGSWRQWRQASPWAQREAPLGPSAAGRAGVDAAEPKLLCHCSGSCCQGDGEVPTLPPGQHRAVSLRVGRGRGAICPALLGSRDPSFPPPTPPRGVLPRWTPAPFPCCDRASAPSCGLGVPKTKCLPHRGGARAHAALSRARSVMGGG